MYFMITMLTTSHIIIMFQLLPWLQNDLERSLQQQMHTMRIPFCTLLWFNLLTIVIIKEVSLFPGSVLKNTL